jgi:hypothetical protein
MRSGLTRVALVLALLFGACTARPTLTAQAGEAGVQVAPGFSLLYRSDPAWHRGTRPAPFGYGRGWSHQRAAIVCELSCG